MSLGDAEEYAKILKCTPNEIFFANPAISNSWHSGDLE
jgi:hypothetical protein